MQPDDRLFVLPDVGEFTTWAQAQIIDPAQAPVRLGTGRVALYRVATSRAAFGLH